MPPPQPILRNSRLSLVTGQCFFEHHWQPGGRPTPTLWDPIEYGWTFNQLRGGKPDPNFDFAWRPSQQSAFWASYLNGQKVDGVGAASAWDAMVPLRIVAPGRPVVSTDNAAERVVYDVYAYPCGLVAALTVQAPRKAAEELEAWRDRTARLRLDAAFTVTDAGGAAKSGLKAANMLEAVLDWHRPKYYGPINEIYRSAEPITIGAVIQADGVDATVALSADLHRILHAMTAWPVNWKTASLPKLADHCLQVSGKSKNAAAGDALYAVGRGRTLWRPGLFTNAPAGKADRLHVLSCLAHNMVAGAAQAESLRLFAQGYESSKAAQAKLSAAFPATAATLLDRLRRGEKTYRSSSLKQLIEDPDSKAEVNALLKRYGRTEF